VTLDLAGEYLRQGIMGIFGRRTQILMRKIIILLPPFAF